MPLTGAINSSIQMTLHYVTERNDLPRACLRAQLAALTTSPLVHRFVSVDRPSPAKMALSELLTQFIVVLVICTGMLLILRYMIKFATQMREYIKKRLNKRKPGSTEAAKLDPWAVSALELTSTIRIA
jgi:hypothetical protein